MARRPFFAHLGRFKGQGQTPIILPFALFFVVFGLHHEVLVQIPHQLAHFAPVSINLLTGRWTTFFARINLPYGTTSAWNNGNNSLLAICEGSSWESDFIVGCSAHNSTHINAIIALFIGWSIQRCTTIWYYFGVNTLSRFKSFNRRFKSINEDYSH